MKTPLDFIDAGASDEEPVKGITQGDLRRWHDQIQDSFDLGFRAAGGSIHPIKPAPKKKMSYPAEPYREIGWLGGWDVEPTK